MRPWDHLRALFVAFHLGAVLLLSFPAPVGGMTRANFEASATQAMFSQISSGLGALGLEVPIKRVEELAWAGGTRFMAARAVVIAPFRPYAEWTGARQGWRMFWALNRRPALLVVEIEEGGVWRELYRARSNEAEWLRTELDHERLRAVVNSFSWLRDRSEWKHFSTWLARRAAQDFPQATGLRMYMAQRPIPKPEALARGEREPEKRRWEETFDLGSLR